jgi:hypothetical protein
MSYLNGWDKEIPNLDVVDDYESEKQEILNVQGKSFPFSFADVSYTIHEITVNYPSLSYVQYVIKTVIGSIDNWFDLLDEVPISTDEYGGTKPTTTMNNETNDNDE